MTVVVFDPSDSDRAEANAHAFNECASTTFLYNEKGCFKMPNLRLAVDLPQEDSLSILLLHDTDEARWNRLSPPEPNVIVRYTGGRGIQESEGEHWISQRPITGEEDALSAEEAQQILSWARKVLKGEDARLPAIMQEPVDVDHLSALSILCQGYLAVHANRRGEEENTESALDQMGWSEGLLSDGGDDRVEEVSNPDWWRVFDDEDSLLEEAEEEWGNEADGWPTVKKLLKRVTGDTDEEDSDEGDTETEPEPLEFEEDRELVANAYCKLAERLGGEPCQ